MTRVLLLDIDGVLVTERTWETSIGQFAAFDPDCVEALNGLLAQTGAKVVVTLRPFPKTDIAQKVAEAVRHAPSV